VAFVGVALLIAVGLAVLVSADVGSLVGLSQGQTGALLPLVVLLVVFCASLFAHRLPARHLVQGLLGWAAIFLIVVGVYTYRFELMGFSDRIMAELTPGAGVVAEDGQSVTFRRGLGSSFHLDTEVNGSNVRMIFDTGASAVVLSRDDARAAGIDVDGLSYSIPVQTANGMGRAAAITIERMSVGGIERRGVRAFVAEDGALETSLLGMSYLETLEGYSVDRNALELRG